MPYYRIQVWIKNQSNPVQSIKLLGEANINIVYNQYTSKALAFYKSNYVDCEVQMLSKLCSAVREWEKKKGSKA